MDLMNRRGLIGSKKTDGIILPDAYQRCAWIESDGNQLITTDVYLRENYIHTAYTYMLMRADGDTTGFGWIANNTAQQGIGFAGYYRTRFQFWYAGYFYAFREVINQQANIKYGVDCTFRDGFQEIVLNGADREEFNRVLTDTQIPATPLSIFGWYKPSTDQKTYLAPIRIYNLYLEDTQGDLGHFIPCYRKADVEIGMYDLVGQKFYSNIGSGAFTKGADV